MTDRIMVYAGSQTTDIMISTEGSDYPMSAKKIVLSYNTLPLVGSNTQNLTYSSWRHSFMFFQEQLSINFRVGALLNTPKGLYYIDWTIAETRQDTNSGKTAHYYAPVKTLVEVVALVNNTYEFSVD
jgi:hypothetical protein